MPQRYQRPYPPEFRREAVGLVKVSGRSIRDVAASSASARSRFGSGSGRISSTAASATTA